MKALKVIGIKLAAAVDLALDIAIYGLVVFFLAFLVVGGGLLAATLAGVV